GIIEKKPTSGAFDMNELLMYTAGMTGAQLELVGKEAAFYCLRHSLAAITQEILIGQINAIKYGERQSYISPEQTFKETAIYEAGRAVTSKLLMPHVQIEHVSLTPKENNEHFVAHDYSDVQENMTIQDFKSKICISLAGRIAQIKRFGEIRGIDTGATNDIQQATRDAYAAIALYGMDKEVGYININGVDDAKRTLTRASEHYHQSIDIALKRWIKEGEKSTSDLINQHWSIIEKLAESLLDKEIIYAEELDEIISL
ncbi:MAG TPA: hypothetical protein EYG70_01555, partial [Sulfurimonas sp.]|nr:hypothetical protein [Sulfurimonas sp.]